MNQLKNYKKELSFIAVIILLGLAGSVLASLFSLEELLRSSSIIHFVEEHYVLSVLIYLVVMALATSLFALPGVVFAVISAMLFGPVWGTVWCTLAAGIGAVFAFILGRYFLHDSISQKLSESKVLSSILLSDKIENQVLLLAITRLIPIFPFNLQNFAYGITNISLGVYAVFSTLFLIPGTALYTFLTAGIINEQERGLYFIVTLVFVILVLALSFILAKKYRSIKGD